MRETMKQLSDALAERAKSIRREVGKVQAGDCPPAAEAAQRLQKALASADKAAVALKAVLAHERPAD